MKIKKEIYLLPLPITSIWPSSPCGRLLSLSQKPSSLSFSSFSWAETQVAPVATPLLPCFCLRGPQSLGSPARPRGRSPLAVVADRSVPHRSFADRWDPHVELVPYLVFKPDSMASSNRPCVILALGVSRTSRTS